MTLANNTQALPASIIAAIYGRTSHETDDAFSVLSQIEAGLLYAQRHSFTLPESYIFREDFTGKVLDRPEYNKIRELVRSRKIQMLIVYATDRFARKVGVGDMLLDELMQYGVQLHIVVWDSYVRDVPEDRLRFNFEMTYSDFERGKIVERTTRGKIKKLQEGYIIGCTRAPYGYELIGTRKHAQLAIVEEQAEIVREIFKMYAYEHLGPVLIARKLMLRGIPSPGDLRAQDWGPGSAEKMRYTPGWSLNGVYEILYREAYTGRYAMTVHNTTVYVNIPCIIDEELWVATQERLKEGRLISRRNTTHFYLIARRLRCAKCNKAAVVHKQYYKCGSRMNKLRQPHCGAPYFRIDQVDRQAWEFTKELLLNPTRLFLAWKEDQERRQQGNAVIYDDMARIERKIEENKGALARMLDRLDVLSNDERDADERAYYEQKRDMIKQILFDLREEYKILQAKVAPAGIPERIIRSLAEMGDDYRELLERDDLDFDFQRGLIDDLDIRGFVGVEQESGRKYADFIYCGKMKRKYLDGEADTGSGDQSKAQVQQALGEILEHQDLFAKPQRPS
jgi:site-specific DNA recombinase